MTEGGKYPRYHLILSLPYGKSDLVEYDRSLHKRRLDRNRLQCITVFPVAVSGDPVVALGLPDQRTPFSTKLTECIWQVSLYRLTPTDGSLRDR